METAHSPYATRTAQRSHPISPQNKVANQVKQEQLALKAKLVLRVKLVKQVYKDLLEQMELMVKPGHKV